MAPLLALIWTALTWIWSAKFISGLVIGALVPAVKVYVLMAEKKAAAAIKTIPVKTV